MAHHIYTTPAYVLRTTQREETSSFVTLLTRNLGVISGVAKGLRLIKSKLRYSLQPFSRVVVALVRGKNVWRVANAREEFNIYFSHKENKELIQAVARIFYLIERLVPGEEKNEKLFDIVEKAIHFCGTTSFTKENIQAFEYVTVLKILHCLGYGKEDKEIQIFTDSPLSMELLSTMKDKKRMIVPEINKAIRESQL